MAKEAASNPKAPDFYTAFYVLRTTADPTFLLQHLRRGEPIPAEHAEELARLFDPKETTLEVRAEIKRHTKGMQDRSHQRRAIFRSVMEVRGGDWHNRMPPGAWDAIAAAFGLSRKAVETAYQQHKKVIEAIIAQEKAEEQMTEEGWGPDEGDGPT